MNREELDLISAAVDGTISPAELPRLQELLNSDKTALDLYCHEALIHGELEWHYSISRQIPAASKRRAVVVDEVRHRQQQRNLRISFAAAAVLTLSLAGTFFFIKSLDQPSIALRFNQTAKFEILRKSGSSESATLQSGDTLALTHGAAELTLPHGVRSILEAPASLTMTGKNSVSMDHGRAFFEVFKKEGRGFTVTLPNSTVTDLGTRFGIIANTGAPSEVHVIEGKVRTVRTKGKFSKLSTLSNNNSVREDDTSPTGYSVIGLAGFAHNLGETDEMVSFSFEKTNRDGMYVASNGALARPVSVNGGVISEVAGIRGSAIRFDGTGSHLEVSGWNGFEDEHPGAISLWIRVIPTEFPKLTCPLSWGTPEKEEYGRWSIATISSEESSSLDIRSGIPATRHIKGTRRFATREWINVTFVFQNNGDKVATIYINGQPDSSSPLEFASSLNTDYFLIGTHISEDLWESHGFSGDVDEIRFYRKPLTLEQIESFQSR